MVEMQNLVEVSKEQYDDIFEIYNTLPMTKYEFPDYYLKEFTIGDSAGESPTKIYLDVDSIPEEVKPVLRHRGIYIETFWYKPL